MKATQPTTCKKSPAAYAQRQGEPRREWRREETSNMARPTDATRVSVPCRRAGSAGARPCRRATTAVCARCIATTTCRFRIRRRACWHWKPPAISWCAGACSLHWPVWGCRSMSAHPSLRNPTLSAKCCWHWKKRVPTPCA